jgi:hypothetical protein
MTSSDYKICARWTVFVSPLTNIIPVKDIQDSPLLGHVLCISEDGTIAVIAIDEFQL